MKRFKETPEGRKIMLAFNGKIADFLQVWPELIDLILPGGLSFSALASMEISPGTERHLEFPRRYSSILRVTGTGITYRNQVPGLVQGLKRSSTLFSSSKLTEQLFRAGAGGCIVYFGRLYHALKFAFPTIEWDESKFSNKGKKARQQYENDFFLYKHRWLLKMVAQMFPQPTRLVENFLVPDLLWGLLSICCCSLPKILRRRWN